MSGKKPACNDRTPEVYMTIRVPMMPTNRIGAAIISRMLRGSRSGRAIGAATATRVGATEGGGWRLSRTNPLLDIV